MSLSYRIAYVFLRNLYSYKRFIVPTFLVSLIEPLFYLVTFGVGMGAYMGAFGGKPYLDFLVPGVLASAAMMAASFECLYGTYVKIVHEKVYDSLVATPVENGFGSTLPVPSDKEASVTTPKETVEAHLPRLFDAPPDVVVIVDPTVIGDRVINNVVTTALGLTMIRTIRQFGQQYHNNYIISDYRFVNTSNKRLDSVRVCGW